MKRLGVAVILLFVLASSLGAQAEITIGVILSMTGSAASLGIPTKNVLSFAPTTIAGEKVRYVYYDDASDTTQAVQDAKRLISEDKVDLVIGPNITTCALAIIDAMAESKTPNLTLAASTSLIAPVDAKRHWIFKVPANDDVYNAPMVAHMAKHGVKTVSIIAFDDPYGEVNIQEYSKLATKYGIKTLTIEKYKRTDITVVAQVLHAMKGNPDAVYIIGSGTPAALPHRTLIEHGYKGKIYQTGGAGNADFLRVGGKAVEGGFLPLPPSMVAEQLPNGYPTKAEGVKFAKAFESKFGPRSNFAANAWDTMGLISVAVPQALKVAKPGTPEFRAALRDALENIKGFRGASAVYNLSPTDHSGVNELGMSVIKIQNGTWKLEDYAKFK